MTPSIETRAFLRHSLATLAYRGGKPLRAAPVSFAAFQASPTTRTPIQILAHIGDLMDWALSMAKGKQQWKDAPPLAWDEECARFFATLSALDAFLASDAPLECPVESLFQGPIADALTHVGQITLLRRIEGTPMRGENYAQADIEIGRVGPAQPPAKREFD